MEEAAVWDVAEVRVRLQGRERTVLAFGLGVDPLGKRLIPVDAYLA